MVALVGRAVVVVGRGVVVVGAAVIVVGAAAVVVVAGDVDVDDCGTGSSMAATSIIGREGETPAGDAPADAEAPTRDAARSGLAIAGLMAWRRIAG